MMRKRRAVPIPAQFLEAPAQIYLARKTMSLRVEVVWLNANKATLDMATQSTAAILELKFIRVSIKSIN